MFPDCEGEVFYKYAMSLFQEAGHVFISDPEFYNHSPEQFAYFDNKSDSSFSSEERKIFKCFNNISRLFTVNECVFFSINLISSHSERSELAHAIHTMLHPILETEGSIFLFRFEDEVMLSFMGFGYYCLLSDWYPMFDPYDHLLRKLDIVNMGINSSKDYFDDLVFSLARDYYFRGQTQNVLSILPLDTHARLDREEIYREDLDQIVEDGLFAAYRQYGDDYVEYDEKTLPKGINMEADIDLMFLDMDMEPDNPFDDEMVDDNADSTEEDFDSYDEYEFEGIDPEVFRDPTLLVKLLKKQDNENS